MFLFEEHFGKLFDWLDPICDAIAVTGEFTNDDIFETICRQRVCAVVKQTTQEQAH